MEERNDVPTYPIAASYRSASDEDSVPVEAGTQELQIRVKVVYEIA